MIASDIGRSIRCTIRKCSQISVSSINWTKQFRDQAAEKKTSYITPWALIKQPTKWTRCQSIHRLGQSPLWYLASHSQSLSRWTACNYLTIFCKQSQPTSTQFPHQVTRKARHKLHPIKVLVCQEVEVYVPGYHRLAVHRYWRGIQEVWTVRVKVGGISLIQL